MAEASKLLAAGGGVGLEVTSCEIGGCGTAGVVCASAALVARINKTGIVRRKDIICLLETA